MSKALSRSEPDLSFRTALFLLGFYFVLGFSFNFLLPLRDMEHWFRIFLWGTLLRASGFLILSYADARGGGRTPFRFKGMPWPRALGHGALMVGLWGLLMTHASGASWSWGQRLAAVPACLMVGLFEEYLFRGILLRGLLARLKPSMAVLSSSLLFTLFHTRFQALAAWPHIFLTGVVFANLRRRGMSLGQLSLIHAAADSLFFFVGRDMGSEYGKIYWVFLAGLFLYAALTHDE